MMDYKIETRCIHGSKETVQGHPFGAVAVPIFQTATFSHPAIGISTGYDYSRESNPTRTELEKLVTSLEGAADTVACATGMAAISLCLELFAAGDHIICSDDLYGGSVRIFEAAAARRQLEFTYADSTDPDLVEKEIRANTKALYIETPSNPTMKVTDLQAMKDLARQYQLLLIVDNTFLTPYFQKPVELGADIVIHSGTKFLGGHNDTLSGFVCTADDTLARQIRFLYKTFGSCLAPFDSFLVIRGIKTLSLRLEKQQENARRIAEWLKGHENVRNVYYIGLLEHPGYQTNSRQASGAGSMVSFRVGSEQKARSVLEKVRLITYAESLGGVETLITYPMLQTHGDVPEPIRKKLGITADFLRLSVGVEHCEDLIADLSQALQ